MQYREDSRYSNNPKPNKITETVPQSLKQEHRLQTIKAILTTIIIIRDPQREIHKPKRPEIPP